MNVDQIQSIVEKQRNYFNSNATRELTFRKALLKKLATVLKAHESELTAAIHADFHKSEFDTYTTEFALLYSDINETLKELDNWVRPQSVRTNLMNLPGKSTIYREPYGVCFVIGAWNYPFQLTLAPAIAALAAGNTVIIKASELPSQSAQALAKMINANFDPGVLHVVEGGGDVTQAVINAKMDYIFFTGSVRVGRIIYEAAAKHLTPVTLELGGKSPAIIDESADLKTTVKRLVWGKFLNAGQTCIATDYVYVHHSLYDSFLTELKKQIEANQYALENNNYVQIINEQHFNRLKELIPMDKVYFGGETNEHNRYIAPTVLTNVNWQDLVMQEEIFGPILPVFTYADLEEVIKAIQSQPKPLALYLFSRKSSTKKRIVNELSFGGGAINDTIMHITNSHLPFGGVGNSGIGSYHGEAGFKTFSHEKSVFEKPLWGEPNIKFPPYSSNKLKWIKRLLKLNSSF